MVRFKGRFALPITHTTPHEAMVEDLLFVRDVLDGAGIEYLLVRGNDERPVIAVNWAQRKALRAALVEACEDRPFYSKTVDAKKAPRSWSPTAACPRRRRPASSGCSVRACTWRAA